METISEWSFHGERCFDVFDILFIRILSWYLEGKSLTFTEGEQFKFVPESIVHDVEKIVVAQSTVPIVNDVSTVHNFTENIDKIVPRYFTP